MKKKQKAKNKVKSKKARIIMVIGLPALFLLGLFFMLLGIPTTASITSISATNEQKILIGGDVNGDGTVNIVDSMLIMQHTVKLRQLVPNQFNSADVNKDSSIDITDALFIAQYTVGTRRQLLDLPTKDIVAFAESKQLSQIWWKLTRQERWDISTILIDDFQNQIGTIFFYCKGICTSNNIESASCVQNAVIRQKKFNGVPDGYSELSHYYYKVTNGKDKNLINFYSEKSYNLPVYLVNLDNPYHTVVAIQISENKSNFNSWRFFQYDNNNITPKGGSYQMSANRHVQILETDYITPEGFDEGKDLAHFYINSTAEVSVI